MKDKKYFISIFLNLKKAYDTVNHTMFFDKLEAHGIRRCALNWFETYLSSRIQRVRIVDTVSEPNERRDNWYPPRIRFRGIFISCLYQRFAMRFLKYICGIIRRKYLYIFH